MRAARHIALLLLRAYAQESKLSNALRTNWDCHIGVLYCDKVECRPALGARTATNNPEYFIFSIGRVAARARTPSPRSGAPLTHHFPNGYPLHLYWQLAIGEGRLGWNSCATLWSPNSYMCGFPSCAVSQKSVKRSAPMHGVLGVLHQMLTLRATWTRSQVSNNYSIVGYPSF